MKCSIKHIIMNRMIITTTWAVNTNLIGFILTSCRSVSSRFFHTKHPENENSPVSLGSFLCIPTPNTGQLNPLSHTFAEFRLMVNRIVTRQSTDWLAANAPHVTFPIIFTAVQGKVMFSVRSVKRGFGFYPIMHYG